MTEEDPRDVACAKKAHDTIFPRNTFNPGDVIEIALVEAARLARTGWTPPPKVDPDVLEVRKLVAEYYRSIGWLRAAKEMLAGELDGLITFQASLAAIRRGREIERANPSKDD